MRHTRKNLHLSLSRRELLGSGAAAVGAAMAAHTVAAAVPAGPQVKLGPDLYKVTQRRDDKWLAQWLKNPEAMLKSDAAVKQMLDKYKVPMPNQNLSDEEIREFLAYFKWADANLRPQGATQPQPAAPGTAKNPSETLSATPMANGEKKK